MSSNRLLKNLGKKGKNRDSEFDCPTPSTGNTAPVINFATAYCNK